MNGETGGSISINPVPEASLPDFNSDLSFGPAFDTNLQLSGPIVSVHDNIDLGDLNPEVPFISEIEIRNYEENILGLEELGIIDSPFTGPADTEARIIGINGAASNEIRDGAAALRREVGTITTTGIGVDTMSMPGSTLSPEYWKLQESLMIDGTHNFPLPVIKQQLATWQAMPLAEALPAIQAWNNQFGQQPKNGFNPKNWGAGDWIAASTLLVQFLQNKEIMKQNKELRDRTDERADELFAHTVKMDEANLALSQAQLNNQTPGKGGKIGKTSIYS